MNHDDTMNSLTAQCKCCGKVHDLGNYTWPEIIAECGGDLPICDVCGEDLSA